MAQHGPLGGRIWHFQIQPDTQYKAISLHSGLISLHSGFHSFQHMSKPKVHQLAAVMAQKTGPSDPRRLKLLDCISWFLQRVRMVFFFMFHRAGFLNLVPRFLQSLAPKVENPDDVQESDARPMPKAASSSDSRKGFFKELKREEPEVEKEKWKVTATVNFSQESLLQFKEDNLLHTTAAVTLSAPPRKRPNYDNRKRKFMATQQEERRE